MSFTPIVPLIRTVYLRHIVEQFSLLDSSIHKLVESAGFPQQFYESSSGYIPVAPFHRLLFQLEEVYSLSDIVSVLQSSIKGAYVPKVMILLEGTGTVREALETLVRTIDQETEYTRLELEFDSLGNVTLWRELSLPDDKETHWTEFFSVIALLEIIRGFTSPGFVPDKLFFRTEQAHEFSDVSFIKGDLIFTGYQRTGIFISADNLDKKYAIDSPLGENFNSQLQSSFEESIEELIKAYMGNPVCSIDEIAILIDVPVRTIQRRLARTGSSFKQLKEKVLMEAAQVKLLQGKEAATVALELGYSCTQAFSRAFKKALGKGPRAWLKENLVE